MSKYYSTIHKDTFFVSTRKRKDENFKIVKAIKYSYVYFKNSSLQFTFFHSLLKWIHTVFFTVQHVKCVIIVKIVLCE